ncbi:hypothetical protein PHISP_01727 [Aspergillus sp. HF37]|nr:hypothetical protein PHISP_01727 [Aspergillus sp. HF37]
MPDSNISLTGELARLREFAQNAIRSGAYFYPLKGIFYLTTHKTLWPPLLSRAGPTAVIGLGVTTTMFLFTYVPQATLLAFTSGPLAPISAALLVLSESSTITNFLARSFLLRDALIDIFDGTLVARGESALVKRGREVKSAAAAGGQEGEGNPIIGRLGKLLKRPFGLGGDGFNPKQALLRSLLYLPLNFIPVVGTVAYLLVQGRKVGPALHERYFQLKGWDAKKCAEWVDRNREAYTAFGAVAASLEMVPFLSLVFAFTNSVAGALWAADVEGVVK